MMPEIIFPLPTNNIAKAFLSGAFFKLGYYYGSVHKYWSYLYKDSLCCEF